MRRLTRFAALSLLVGAVASVSLNWMAAWDESYPTPDFLPPGYSHEDPDLLATYLTSGQYLKRVWKAVTPREWHVSARVWVGAEYPFRRSTDTEIRGDGFDGKGGQWRVAWRRGLGLSDSLSVKTFVIVAPSDGWTSEQVKPIAKDYLYSIVTFNSEQTAPSELCDRGIPECSVFRSSSQWSGVRLPAWATLTGTTPARTQPLDVASWEDALDESARGRWFAAGTTTEEVRAYGWPLRCMLVRGWRSSLRWFDPTSTEQYPIESEDEWWSEGIGTLPPLLFADGEQLTLPATGLPWRPLWLPFLVNTVILGVPLTLSCVGLTRGSRWCWRRVRGRGGKRCAHCGYSREGIACETPCPECGERTSLVRHASSKEGGSR